MPTATQSYGNTTIGNDNLDTDKEYPVLGMGDGYFIHMTSMSIRNYLVELGVPFQAIAFPDFIITSKEGALTIQGMLTVLNLPVCVVTLLDVPIPTEGDDLGAVFLVTVDASHHELKALVDRIPSIVGGYDIDTTYILIHGND